MVENRKIYMLLESMLSINVSNMTCFALFKLITKFNKIVQIKGSNPSPKLAE